MGRTLPTSTQLIQEFEETCKPYARALRKEDRDVLFQLFAMIRLQSAPIAYSARPNPFPIFVLAMLGGILKRLIRIERLVAAQNASGSTEQEEVEWTEGPCDD